MNTFLNSRISQICTAFAEKKVTSLELCSLCLGRVKKTKELNAFVTIDELSVENEAKQSDIRRQSGSAKSIVDGVPIAVKDNFCTAGIRTTCASKMLLNYVPPYNATVVERVFNESGAILLGKTNMDEFAMGAGSVDSVFGPVRNPWKLSKTKDDFYICGGSSGGSAVAVATGCSFAAIASDTGGSTRNPAARVGVVGFKPTYGIASRYGLIPLTHSMDVPGILTRFVEDAATVFKLFAGVDSMDSTTVNQSFDKNMCEIDMTEITVGIPKEYDCDGLSAEVRELWKKVADELSNAGAKVVDVSMPHTRYSISCYTVLNACEVASNFSCYDGVEFGHRAKNCETSTEEMFATSRFEGLSDVVKGRILAGNFFLLRDNYDMYYNQALKVRRLIANDFENVFSKNIDFLITPVTLTEAPLYSQWIKKDNREQVATEDFCTQPVNMSGVPAVSIPCKLSENGL
ncbi:glutamyl-tRNA(Gln) amidotransferase subunit A-like protein, partial [Leptotrombidium deliense]